MDLMLSIMMDLRRYYLIDYKKIDSFLSKVFRTKKH